LQKNKKEESRKISLHNEGSPEDKVIYMVDISDIVGFESLEDRLTSQFIATLEHTPMDKVLKPFLKAIGFDLNIEKGIKEVKFGLQIQEVSSIPDAKIEGKSFLIYIEVKRGDSVDPSQIERHFEGGKGRKPKFCILCITSGLYKPSGIVEAERKLKEKEETSNIKWMNWKKVYELMKGSEKRVNDEKSQFLISSFNSTLEKQGLVGFTGFDKDEFTLAKELIEKYTQLLKKCNQLMYEVTEELKKSSIKQVGSYRDGRSTKKLDLLTYAEYWFNKENWVPTSPDQLEDGSVAFIGFMFWNAALVIGALVNRQIIYKKNVDWKGFLESFPFTHISYKIIGGERTWAESTRELLDKIEETRSDKTLDRVFIDFIINSEEYELEKPEVKAITKFINQSLESLQQYGLFELQV